MTFAEVTLDGDLNTYATEVLVFFLLIGGALFFLGYIVLGQSPVSSSSSPRQTFVPRQDSFSTPSTPEQASSQKRSGGRRRPALPGQQGDPRERRAALRRGGDPVPVVVTNAESPVEPLEGSVLDRSRGGMRLALRQPVEVGKLLDVRAPHFPPDLASVRVRVRHCKQKGEFWLLGCQFVEELPWSVLLMFG